MGCLREECRIIGGAGNEGAAFGVMDRQKGENEAVEWTSDQAVLDAV